MGREARLRKQSVVDCPLHHVDVYRCPRCRDCFKCKHGQVGALPDLYWTCPDGVRVWVNSDGTFKEIL